jgi:membrane dipeptidase
LGSQWGKLRVRGNQVNLPKMFSGGLVAQLILIDHVGISSDFDGGGGVDGWNGADETFSVTLELVRRGYTDPQIAKIWSGDLLRVMDEVQKAAR